MSELRNKIVKMHKRWQIAINPEDEFERFKTRIITAIDISVGQFIVSDRRIIPAFAIQVGYSMPPQSASGLASLAPVSQIFYGTTFYNTHICSSIQSSRNLSELIQILQGLIWILEEYQCPQLDYFVKSLRFAINASPYIMVNISSSKNKLLLYPTGAKILDLKTVDDNLMWLEDFPLVYKHFSNALDILQKKDAALYRNLLDELRLSLEILLKNILTNRKSLEKQKVILMRWLEGKGVHVHIRNQFNSIISYFIEYQNSAVKHDEKWSECEIEYMVYLTGTFVRFVLMLHTPKI